MLQWSWKCQTYERFYSKVVSLLARSSMLNSHASDFGRTMLDRQIHSLSLCISQQRFLGKPGSNEVAIHDPYNNFDGMDC